jgi:hypothetical protein
MSRANSIKIRVTLRLRATLRLPGSIVALLAWLAGN